MTTPDMPDIVSPKWILLAAATCVLNDTQKGGCFIYDKLAATGNLIANMDATGGLLNSLSDDMQIVLHAKVISQKNVLVSSEYNQRLRRAQIICLQ